MQKNTNKYFSILALTTAFLLILIWSFNLEPNVIRIKNIPISLPKWHKEHKNLRIAVLSDFHIGFGHIDRAKLKKIIRLTNEVKPDLIFLLGDYVNLAEKNQKYLNHLEIFKKFKAKYGVYAVMGNHESWKVRYKIRYYLKRANVKLLENRAEKVIINEKPIWVAGIDDWTTGYPDIPGTIGQIEDKHPILFLSHNPDVLDDVPERVSLTIAGHTHGGQIYVPFLVRLVTPSRLGKKFLKGYVVKDEKHCYISSGLGTTILPARFLVPPEISVLTLN